MSSNRDGGGIAYVANGKVEISKGFFVFGQFMAEYKRLFDLYGKDNPMLIHFRIATQGMVNKNNCHPFPIKGGALIHNGSLWNIGGTQAKVSDTRDFASTVHNILNYEDVSECVDELGKAINSWNKVAMLYDNGKTIVLNKYKWYEDDGILYSHSGYKGYSPKASTK